MGVRPGGRRAFLCASALGLVLGTSTAFADVVGQQEGEVGDPAAAQPAARLDSAGADEPELVQDAQDAPATYATVTYDDVAGDDSDEQGAPEPYAGAQAWSASASVDVSSASVGQQVNVYASPAQAGFSYNFVWERDGWADWDSDVKSTGSFASGSSRSFTPSAPGTYRFYVDVRDDSTGEVRTVSAGAVEVSAGQWSASASVDVSSASVGQQVNVYASPAQAGFSYNFVWERDGWADWDSDVKSTGSFASGSSRSFTPSAPGTYRFYVDVRDDSTGEVRTVSAGTVEVPASQWSASIQLSTDTAVVGAPVTVTPQVQGLPAGTACTYNYVYNYNGAWEDWNSTVLSTGGRTSQTSWQFTPQREGTYFLYVDVVLPGGEARTFATTLKVERGYACEGLEASAATITQGQSVTLTPKLTGPASDFTFNWVWQRDDWAAWDSTVKSTGAMTSESSATFTPSEPGDYTFYVDARNSAGVTSTHSVKVRVEAADTLNLSNFQVTLADGGAGMLFALPSGSVPRTGAARVAVWAEGSSEASAVWYDLSCDADGSWSAQVPLSSLGNGSYACRVYGKTSSGGWQAGSEGSFTLPLTPIMSGSQVDARRLVTAYRSSGASYPSQVYASKGAPTIEDFCNIVVSEASAEGVDARVVFAQIMTETGWLRFGGDVKAEQCNFGGIGATGAGVSGNSFADVREGVRAQVQHLKAYASSAALANPVVDPRYTYVNHGVMPYVEGLGTRWASGSSYGWDLASFVRSL